jgi:ceramide glucosyltransferase
MAAAHALIASTGALLSFVAAGYSVVALVAVLVWRLRPRQPLATGKLPPVTLLKPLCGAEAGLYGNLRSFCLQNYPLLQMVCGAQDPDDPAIGVVRTLQQEFPALHIELVVDDAQHGSNRKVNNLINMMRAARHDVLVIADSDVCVGSDYLCNIAPQLHDPQVGLVTCLYRRIPAAGIWSRLGSMYINDWYMPSVLVAWLFGHRGYTSGQTMAFRRDTLQAMGGFGAIVNHLADDHEMGERVRRLGLRIVLSPYLVATLQHEPTEAALLAHETRWMRTLRALTPAGFAFLFISFSLVIQFVAFLLLSLDPALSERLSVLLIVTIAARLAISCVQRLGQPVVPLSDLWLLPVRDMFLCWVWARALFTSQISWRGGQFEVDARGVIRSSP